MTTKLWIVAYSVAIVEGKVSRGASCGAAFRAFATASKVYQG